MTYCISDASENAIFIRNTRVIHCSRKNEFFSEVGRIKEKHNLKVKRQKDANHGLDMTDGPSDGIELRRMFKMLNFSS